MSGRVQAVVMVVLLMFILFGGFYLNAHNSPPEFIWVPYLSYVRFAFETGVVNEFQGKTLVCPAPPAFCQFPTYALGKNTLPFRCTVLPS
jgi:hypothetical protein